MRNEGESLSTLTRRSLLLPEGEGQLSRLSFSPWEKVARSAG